MDPSFSPRPTQNRNECLHLAIGADIDPIVKCLSDSFKSFKKFEATFRTSEWQDSQVALHINPIIESTRRFIKDRKIPVVEIIDMNIYDHLYPVFSFEQWDEPIAMVARRCAERFSIPLVFDPAGLALSRAEALSVEDKFGSISMAEFLLSKPFAATAHEIYHIASARQPCSADQSPDFFYFLALEDNLLGQICDGAGSEAFAPLFAGCFNLELTNLEGDPLLNRFLLSDALSSFREGLTSCKYLDDAIAIGINLTLNKIERLATNGALIVDTKELEEYGEMKIGLPSSQPDSRSSPTIRLFFNYATKEITVQLTGEKTQWRTVTTFGLDQTGYGKQTLLESLKTAARESAYATLNCEPMRAIIHVLLDGTNVFRQKILRIKELYGDLEDITTGILQGRTIQSQKLASLLESAAQWYPSIQSAGREVLLGE